MARSKELTESITFRLTPPERAALESLAAARVHAARDAGYDTDPTLGAYLRHAIREAAKSAGLPLDAAPPEPSAAPTPAKPPRKVGPKKGARR